MVDCGIARDDPQILLDVLKKSLSKCDVLVTTGGVSMGDRDLLRWVNNITVITTSIEIA